MARFFCHCLSLLNLYNFSFVDTLSANKIEEMVTLASHISDYFEQFNSSLTNDFNSNTNGLSTDKNLRIYYVFDFERYSDKIGTLSDLRTFMIERWHNSFFYAIAYLLLIYGKFGSKI